MFVFVKLQYGKFDNTCKCILRISKGTSRTESWNCNWNINEVVYLFLPPSSGISIHFGQGHPSNKVNTFYGTLLKCIEATLIYGQNVLRTDIRIDRHTLYVMCVFVCDKNLPFIFICIVRHSRTWYTERNLYTQEERHF